MLKIRSLQLLSFCFLNNVLFLSSIHAAMPSSKGGMSPRDTETIVTSARQRRLPLYIDSHIPPVTDTTFKIIFGKEGESEPRVKEFLNLLFFNGEAVIDSVTILSTEVLEIEGTKVIFDVKCKADKVTSLGLKCGTQFIIEMQKKAQGFIYKHLLTYCARELSSRWLELSQYHKIRAQEKEYRVNVEDQYKMMKPIWIVLVTDCIVFQDDIKDIPRFWEMVDTQKRDTRVNDMIRFCFIEVPKIAKKFKDHGHIKTMLDRWLCFMKAGQTTKTELSKTLVGKSPNLATAYLRLQHLSASEQLEQIRTALASEKAARKKVETALASEKLKIQSGIKNLLAQGKSPEEIATIFSISVAEIIAIAKSY